MQSSEIEVDFSHELVPRIDATMRRSPKPLRRSSHLVRDEHGGSPNVLRITLSAFESKHRPWLSKIRRDCHDWIFPIAAAAFCRWRSSGSRIPKKI
jgi:hypothetical protein